MDLSNIFKLLPEFLEMFKGKDVAGLQDFIPSLGNNDMLKNLFEKSGKYTKYLPLLPLLGRINKEGFTGLLSNAEDIKPVFSLLSETDNKYAKMLKDVDPDTIVKYLPLLLGFLSKNKKEKNTESNTILPLLSEKANTTDSYTDNFTERADLNKKYFNPLSQIAGIAGKDIIYALNTYISNDI